VLHPYQTVSRHAVNKYLYPCTYKVLRFSEHYLTGKDAKYNDFHLNNIAHLYLEALGGVPIEGSIPYPIKKETP